MRQILAAGWLVLLALATPAAAQTFPQLTGRVVDQANLLSPEQELDLSSRSAALEAQTKRQFVVATVSSLEGKTIEDYGYRLGRAWGIGEKDKDDGVILLVAPHEHKVRIETGYGARVFLTDAVSSVITREAILPRFKAGDMAGGITAGADQIIKTMSLSPEAAAQQAGQAQQTEQARQSGSTDYMPVIFWGIILLFILLSMLRHAGGRRYQSRGGGRRGGIDPWVLLWGLNELSRGSRGGWGGGGFGGGGWSGGGGGGFGGFSGGGGSFGGGGASGSW